MVASCGVRNGLEARICDWFANEPRTEPQAGGETEIRPA